MDEEEGGDRAPLGFRIEDDGGENCEFESMSELVHGTELGGFSFDITEAGCCSGDMGATLKGDLFSSLYFLKRIFLNKISFCLKNIFSLN